MAMSGNVTTKQVDWKSLVEEAAGPEEKPVVYNFGGGRQFKDSGEGSGVYANVAATATFNVRSSIGTSFGCPGDVKNAAGTSHSIPTNVVRNSAGTQFTVS